MNQDISSTQDRETIAYHFRKRFETWYGVVMKAKDPSVVEIVEKGLNNILSECPSGTHMPARADGHLVFSAGHYDQDLLERIRSYARDNARLTVILEGSYFDFLGRRWLEHAKEDYKL